MLYILDFVGIKEIIFYVFNKLAEGYENEVRVYLLYLFNDISLDLFIKNILKLNALTILLNAFISFV